MAFVVVLLEEGPEGVGAVAGIVDVPVAMKASTTRSARSVCEKSTMETPFLQRSCTRLGRLAAIPPRESWTTTECAGIMSAKTVDSESLGVSFSSLGRTWSMKSASLNRPSAWTCWGSSKLIAGMLMTGVWVVRDVKHGCGTRVRCVYT